jgi:hypothetical protein
MPKIEKTTRLSEPLTRLRVKLDVEEITNDIQVAIAKNRWEQVAELMSLGSSLSRGLVTMPVNVRVLRELPKDPRFSTSLASGLKILALFSDDSVVLGIADVADALGMNRSTTHRYVISLVGLGQLVQGSGRKYRLAT